MRLLSVLFVFSAFFGHAQDDTAYLIKSIYFGGGSYFVDDRQFLELKDLIDSIPEIRDYTITIHSHTDNIGGAAYNEWLSEMRSKSAMQKLLLLDFESSQMEVRDFGQFNPVYDNNTLEGRFKNRRVDIIFWPLVM